MFVNQKVALITGAGSGIGAASARLLARRGARVAVAGIPAAGVEAVTEELTGMGAEALALATDVSQADQVEAAVQQTVARFGRLDILVPNAGIQLHREDRNLHELPESVWDRTHDVNYRGVMLTCKYGLAQFLRQGDGGVIVMVVSVTATSGRSANVAYLAGKHGLIGLNRYIAVHYARYGVRCNALCPGALERTPMHDDHPDPQTRAARLLETIPLGRAGTPEDIAPWVAFLASDEAGYATGGMYLVDGGMSVA